MPLWRKSLFPLLVALLVAAPVSAQSSESRQRVRFTTQEGTALSFDVSRDGRWIVFDLLGQLWRLPIEGGTAQPLTNAVRDSAELLDPSFAGNGDVIIAHGEALGRFGVFSLPATGGTPRWVAPDTIRSAFQPVRSAGVSPDGQRYLLPRRVTDGSVTVLEHDIATGVKRELAFTGVTGNAPEGLVFSADGTEIFFHTDGGASGIVPLAGRIWRANAAGGEARPFSPAGLLARAAAPSPDGLRVAYFIVDSANRAQVWMQGIHDTTGAPLTRDADITATRIRWLPGGDEIVYVESGRFWRLDTRTGTRRPIPFRATVEFTRRVVQHPSVRFPAPGEEVSARGSSGFALSPDGRSMAVIAIGKLWIIRTDAPSPVARAIADLPPSATAPAWSHDGRLIAWHAGPFGAEDLFVTDTVTHANLRLSALAGRELFPSWSPDGRRLTFGHSAAPDSGTRFQFTQRVVATTLIPVTSVDQTLDLGAAAGPPKWSPGGDALFLPGPQGNLQQRPATLAAADGTWRRPVQGLPADASSFSWVRGDTLVFLAGSRLWRAPLHPADGSLGPATPISDEAVTALTAAPSGDLLYVGPDGYRIRSGTGTPRAMGWPIQYRIPLEPPILIRSIRIIDGTGTPPSGLRDIEVHRGRITRIAPSGRIRARPGQQVLDAGSRVAIPGLIDLHPHYNTAAQLRGLVYYGVTTIRGIGGAGDGQRDAVTAGAWVGPRATSGIRVFANWPLSAGPRLGVEPPADPHHLVRSLAWVPTYNSGLIKLYSNYGWAAQARVTSAAHAAGARVTGHCGYPLVLLAAGIDSKEHLGWQCTIRDRGRWYDDLVQVYARSGTPIVPTLALFGEGQRLQGEWAPLPTELASLFGPFELEWLGWSIDIGTVTTATATNVGYIFDAARALHRAGAVLGAGTDIQRPDGMHFELAALVEASLTPLEAIRAATSVAARIMGAESEVGQIAEGFLADLVILDADPTRDIRNTRRIWRVIQGGRILDREGLLASGWETRGLR